MNKEVRIVLLDNVLPACKFSECHAIAIQSLSQLRDDESESIHKSTGNALHDISRKYKVLVKAELQRWDVTNQRIAQTYRLASRFLSREA